MSSPASLWPTKPLDKVAKIGNGSTPRRTIREYWDNGTIPWLTSAKANEGRIKEADQFVTPRARAEAHLPRVPAGSLVIAITGEGKTLGRTGIVNFETTVSQHLAYVTAQEESVEPEFLFHYLDSQYEALRDAGQGGGTTKGALTCGFLASYEVPIPPPHEQRAIAAALSEADALVAALDDLIAKKRSIKTGMMQQLLTGRTRLPGFTKPWRETLLGRVLTFLRHANNPRRDLGTDGEVRYLHYGDVHAHAAPVLDLFATDLPRIRASKVEGIPRLVDGDLILADASEDLTGTAKSVEILGVGQQEVVSGLHTIVARGEPEAWALGFKAYLQHIPAFKRALERAATGISVYAISKRQVAEIALHLPSRDEQGVIVAVLADMQAEIAALELRREKTRAIKQGMMQSLLTGRVRLMNAKAEA